MVSASHCSSENPRNSCFTCEESESWRCTQSKRHCGHHCNHFWTHDQCCWCEECADMATEDMLDTAEGEDE